MARQPGEERLAGRLAILVFLAGTASAVAVLELFYGLTWLVRAGGFPNATEMMARMSALVIPLITFVYLVITALNQASITTGREVVGSPLFVFLSVLSLLLVLVLLLVQLLWTSARLRRLALWCASGLGPEPWLSLVSVGVGLIAGLCGGITLQLEPTIAAPDWLVGAILSLWFGFDCVVVLLVRAIDTEPTPRQLPEPEQVLSALDADYGLKR